MNESSEEEREDKRRVVVITITTCYNNTFLIENLLTNTNIPIIAAVDKIILYSAAVIRL